MRLRHSEPFKADEHALKCGGGCGAVGPQGFYRFAITP
jgi:hypothetical protein